MNRIMSFASGLVLSFSLSVCAYAQNISIATGGTGGGFLPVGGGLSPLLF